MEVFAGLLVFWISCGIAGYLIGDGKGMAASGFAISFLLGPIGLVLTFLLAGDRRSCPYCKKLVSPDARKCPYCQSDLIPFSNVGGVSESKSNREVESELREILSEMAFEVFRIHKQKDGIFASASMTIDRDLDKVRQVDEAYKELESLKLVESIEEEVRSCPNGPMRRVRRLTDRGKSINF